MKIPNVLLFWVAIAPFSPYLTYRYRIPGGLNSLIIGIIFIFFLANKISNNKPIIKPFLKIDRALILFFIVLFVRSIGSFEPINTLIKWSQSFVVPFIVYLLFREYISNKKFFGKFVYIITILGIVLSIIGIYEWITKENLMVLPSGFFHALKATYPRSNGPFATPVRFGLYQTMIFFLVLYRTNFIKSPYALLKKIFYITILILIAFSIFCCLERSIWGALVFGLILYFLQNRKQRKIGFAFLLISLLIIFNFRINILSQVYKERVSADYYHRIAQYKTAFKIWTGHPFWGIGRVTDYEFTNIVKNPEYISYFRGVSSEGSGIHNTFLSILIMFGLSGFIPFVYFVYKTFFSVFKIKKRIISVEMKLLEILTSTILFVFFFPWLFFSIGFIQVTNMLFFAFLGISIGSFINLKNSKLKNLTP